MLSRPALLKSSTSLNTSMPLALTSPSPLLVNGVLSGAMKKNELSPSAFEVPVFVKVISPLVDWK